MQGIGQLLWKLREKEGIRQKQLCLGISSVSKYARIEADQQEIDFFLIDRIMGRLGKSVERLTYILPRDIYDIYELRQEIQQKICQKKWHSNSCEELVFKILENTVFIRNTAVFVRKSSLSYFPVN